MAWPTDDNPGVMEFQIDGTWTDVTDAVRGNGQIRIDRGRRDIQGSALMPPMTMDFTLNNGGEDPAARGRFTDDNPLSEYFELLPLYTQCRFSMPGASDSYMYTPGHDEANYVSTSDKAALDITGDIDIRIEIAPASWTMTHPDDTFTDYHNILASKTGSPTTQFSWVLSLTSQGQLYFSWTEDGAGAGANVGAIRTDIIENPTDRMAFRVTLDVNNGAGGWSAVVYTSDSIDGTWTSFNTFSSTALGVTSIHSGTGNVEIGGGSNGIGVYSNGKTYSGKVYAFELRDGIGGSIVAEADFRTQTIGDTSFSDGLGNTWATSGDAIITSDAIRFWGEIEEFPDEWDATGKDMLCRMHAADLLSRLGTPSQPAHSPMYTYFNQYSTTSYWPYEDGTDATSASSPSPGATKGTVIDINFQAADDLPGSDGVAQFSSASALARGRGAPATVTGETGALICFRFPTAPVATTQIVSYTTSGSNAYWWRLETDGGSFTIRAFDADGASLLSTAILLGGVDLERWLAIRINLTQDGANIDWDLAWHQIGESGVLFSNGTFAGTAGVFSGYTVSGSSINTDMYFAHVFLDNDHVNFTTDTVQVFNGYIGETYADRFRRICTAIGVESDIDGWKFDTSRLGRQPIDTPLNVLQDGADVDGGFLMGSRRAGNTLTYVTRLRAQTAPYAVSVNHDTDSHLAATPKPVRSPVGVRNDVTVRRPGGGFSRVVVEDGRYGTNSIGAVESEETYNVYSDEQTATIAGWLASLGTSGEKRFPELKFAFNRSETLFGGAIAQDLLVLDVGRWLEIGNMPAGQAPGPFEQIVQGYTEVIDNKTWTISFNGTPYTPWRAGVVQNGTEPLRFAATSTTLATGVNSTATSLSFETPDTSARWITSTEMSSAFPMNVMIAGELITITALTGTTAAGGVFTQTATATRSVNGIVKSLPVDSSIQLQRILRFGR